MDKFASLNQITELDRLAIEQAGLDILQMMEMAGNKFALVVKNHFSNLKGKNILILSGTGNNGGDGLSAARYLSNWGAKVTVILAKQDLKVAPKHHMSILKKMDIDIKSAATSLPPTDLIVDALLGYNQQGDAKSPFDYLISKSNESAAPIFAFDNPSGLNIETGDPTNSTIKATVTVTLAVIKRGLVEQKAKKYVGDLYLVDLGIPKRVYEKVGLEFPFYNVSEKVKDNLII